MIRITDGTVHDVNILDEIGPPVPSTSWIGPTSISNASSCSPSARRSSSYEQPPVDRAYVDFERLFVFTLCSSFFVVRTLGLKKNILLPRRYSHPVDKSTGLRSDQTVILTAIESAKAYPDPLRRVSYFDSRTNKRLQFLTNNFALGQRELRR